MNVRIKLQNDMSPTSASSRSFFLVVNNFNEMDVSIR